MIKSTFGAPFGGTIRGGHHAVDPWTVCLITPPNFGSGLGSCAGFAVVVALGAPGVPVRCAATAVAAFALLTPSLLDVLRGGLSLVDCALQAASASADAQTTRMDCLN